MFVKLLNWMRQLVTTGVQELHDRLRSRTKLPITSFAVGSIHDLARSKPQLVIETALLRQQLTVLNRSVKRPRWTRADQALVILLASRLQRWQDALLIVKPETVLRWQREGFRLFWKRKSPVASQEPKVPAETISMIKEMAANNRLWGAARIRGELLKLNIKVAKRTVQRYMRQAGHRDRMVRPGQPSSRITPRTSGPAISSTSMTCSSGLSSPSSSPSLARGVLSISWVGCSTIIPAALRSARTLRTDSSTLRGQRSSASQTTAKLLCFGG